MRLNEPKILHQIHRELDRNAAVAVVDARGAIHDANPVFGRLTSSALPPPEGQPLAPLLREPDGLLAALGSNEPWQGELALTSGSWLSARLTALDGGVCFLLIGYDISDLKRREAALVLANRDLEHFAYVAAHDLHEPLRKLRAFSERLMAKLTNLIPAEARDYLERMSAAAGRMQDLIDDLLAYSRVVHNRDPFATVDLNRTLQDVLADLELQIESLHQNGVVSAGRLPTVEGDASELYRLFQNLLSNALKFRAPGRAVAISIEPRDEDGFHVISVKDNGIGFAPEDAERIFSGFNRLHTRQEFPGTGIGLSICRRIVERHGGKISAVGRPDQGAEFEIRLPRRPGPTRHEGTA